MSNAKALVILTAFCLMYSCSPLLVYAQDSEDTMDVAEFVSEEVVAVDNGLISLNFRNVKISEALKVLGDITGKVIISNEPLDDTINIESLQLAQPEVAVNILKSAIADKGFNVIESEWTLKVVPLQKTKQASVSVNIGNSPESISDADVVLTQVIPLEHSSALKLKTLLQPLVGSHGSLIADERSNTLILTDASSNIKRIAKIIEQMDQHLPSNHQVKTFMINYGNAETIAEMISNLSNENNQTFFPPSKNPLGGGKYLEFYGTVEATADKETNSILISTSPINFPAIEQLIEELDIFPPQAMIEVVILDVTLDDDFTMGVEFSDSTSPTLTTAGLKFDTTNDNFNESTLHSFLGLGTAASTAGFTWRILNDSETAQALGFILKSQENSKVLSTPKILASNNKESSITVAQEIPILESSVTDLSNNVTNSDIRYQDIGLILRVTPRISRDGYVNLEVHAELSDLSAQTLLNSSVINKREASATVILPDQHTVVMGGLIRDNNSVVENKIPFLGDIPFMGTLFKKTETAALRTELIIFITPHIINRTEDLIRISSEAHSKHDLIKSVKTSEELKKAVEKITDNNKMFFREAFEKTR